MLVFLILKIVIFGVLIVWFGDVVLGMVVELLYFFEHLLFVGDDRHHLLLHLDVRLMEPLPNLNVLRVLLNQTEYLLQNQIVRCVVLHPLTEFAVVELLDRFHPSYELLFELIEVFIVKVVSKDDQFFFDENLIKIFD